MSDTGKKYEPQGWKSPWRWGGFIGGVVAYLFWSIWYAATGSGSFGRAWWAFLFKASSAMATVGMGVVSLLSSSWLAILAINGGLALFWLLPEAEGEWRRGRRFLHEANRQLGHADTALYSSLATLALLHHFRGFIAPLAPVLLLGFCCFGVVVIDRSVVYLKDEKRKKWWWWGGPNDGHLWARRPLFYLVTLVSVFILCVMALGLWQQILWFGATVWIATLLRVYRWWRVARVSREVPDPKDPKREHKTVRAVRRPWLDQVLLWVVLIPLFWPVIGTYTGDEWDKARRAQQAADCAWSGGAPQGPPDVSLFLVADSQFHELGGARTGVHVDLVDSKVPVAVRPVVLDLLSGVTLTHFADIYKKLPGDHKRWAHLGDIADLSCQSELERFTRTNGYLERFGLGGLVALLPGNHDSTFIGNFAWHPEWKAACAPNSQPLTKLESDRMLFDAVQAMPERLAAGETRVGFLQHSVFSLRGAPGSALPWVSRLGYARGREVVGVFLDTSDYTSFRLGLAGAEGNVSSAQIKWVEQELALHPQALVIFFLHHPFDQLALFAQQRVTALATSQGRRLLALVSAHTHLAALRAQHLGGRIVPEVVVGSTIDPPQEAALLELGPGVDGKLWFRLRTVPAVLREGAGCGVSSDQCSPDGVDEVAEGPIPAAHCEEKMEKLAALPKCQGLITRWTQLPEGVPQKVKDDQEEQAQALLRCLCREGEDGKAPCVAGTSVLQNAKVYEPIDTLFKDATRREELVCLSWAASVLQHRKHDPDLPPYDPDLAAQGKMFEQGRKVLLDSFRIGESKNRIPGVLEVAFPTDF